MYSEEIIDLALPRHVAAIKGGNPSIYDCLRFFQNWFRCRLEEDERQNLIKVAALKLIKHDPFFLISEVHGMCVEDLTEAELQSCVASWSLDDEELSAFLEAHLRMTNHSDDQNDLSSVRLVVELLEKARLRFGKQKTFLKLYSNALKILGDERHTTAFDNLLEQTSPEWHAHELRSEMTHAVDEEDWARYDSLRSKWETMPANANICECEINYIANIDGLRSLHRGAPDQAIEFLKQSTQVNGCPHLNTGGGSVILAHELLDHNLAKNEVEEHLRQLEQVCKNEETDELRLRLQTPPIQHQ
ncbi:MAG: hypothetical protein ABF380_10975 [Akkermansiaceae bacterium]